MALYWQWGRAESRALKQPISVLGPRRCGGQIPTPGTRCRFAPTAPGAPSRLAPALGWVPLGRGSPALLSVRSSSKPGSKRRGCGRRGRCPQAAFPNLRVGLGCCEAASREPFASGRGKRMELGSMAAGSDPAAFHRLTREIPHCVALGDPGRGLGQPGGGWGRWAKPRRSRFGGEG